MKKKKGTLSTVILVIVLIAGLCLLIYPSASNYWNSMHQTKAIKTYVSDIEKLSDNDFEEIWKQVNKFNENIKKRDSQFFLSEEETAEYYSLLDISGLGIMGYIDIPSISVTLPIYHGTGNDVLQVAAGHIEWSSLPAGGKGTHSVFSGHRGLPSARLFTDLDKLVVGDVFVLTVLNKTFTYEVEEILIVNPEETDSLCIYDGEDLCTLVTCTPYGINTHRLLVRGHRVENENLSENVRVTADAVKIEPLLVAPILAIPVLLIILVVLLIKDKKRKHGR